MRPKSRYIVFDGFSGLMRTKHASPPSVGDGLVIVGFGCVKDQQSAWVNNIVLSQVEDFGGHIVKRVHRYNDWRLPEAPEDLS